MILSKDQCPPVSLRDYNAKIESMRGEEYPMLKETIYLDFAGTAIPAKSLMERFSRDMTFNLYGNPHSMSAASQHTSARIEEARLRLLQLFNADPDEFDLVFVTNATAGMKLVMDAFREVDEGFWYGYHADSHTSLVGIRETAKIHECFGSDSSVEAWITAGSNGTQSKASNMTGLFGFPAQSNMNGRRLPLRWSGEIRRTFARSTYTLLDAAALVSTSPLDLGNVDDAPDFTVFSLYKLFGFPNLGALIVRKQSGRILERRRYFGGGTVDMALVVGEQWHARKTGSLHDQLEDGTLPIHNIIAIHAALDVHNDLFGSLQLISCHCAWLAQRLYKGLSSLKHGNLRTVCQIYNDPTCDYTDSKVQGPVVAFNLRNSQGAWVPNTELEKLAAVKGISMRTGGLCNPGGIASSLSLSPWEMKRNFSAGQRCGNDYDVIHGKPTGMARVSLGPMSTIQDVEGFLAFVDEFFVEKLSQELRISRPPSTAMVHGRFYVESLTVYPIKSCAGWRIPAGQPWPVHKEGLEWDREWCLVRPGSGTVLTQRRYPRMALIRPVIDFQQGLLRVSCLDATAQLQPIEVQLSRHPAPFGSPIFGEKIANVCGDTIAAQAYQTKAVNDFFTRALGVACHLARFPPTGSSMSTRHAKAHIQPYQRAKSERRDIPGAFPQPDTIPPDDPVARPILLSNESPILLVSRSSLNRLNEQIKNDGGKAVHAEVFRANVVVAEHRSVQLGSEQPYAEDSWRVFQVGRQRFLILGSCRRCQMVCVNQETGTRSEQPFSALAKSRRFDGKVFFGQHACHIQDTWGGNCPDDQNPTIMVGDPVEPLEGEHSKPYVDR